MENYTNEKWTSVRGFEGLYEISDMGRIKSYRKQSGRYKSGSGIRNEGRLLKPQRTIQNYFIVKLYDMDGSFKQFSLHKLVWESFMGKVPELDANGEFLDVHHINSDRGDCRLSNLALIPHSVNVALSKVGDVHRKPIVAKNDDGEIVHEYIMLKAGKKDGYCRTGINKAMRENRKYKGLWWEFVEVKND